MSILTPRLIYKPFEYEQAYSYWLQQQTSHWLPFEVQMAQDIQDFKTVLTDSERNIIGNTLKGFTQAEIFIGEYWAQKVRKWFKKPEIQLMASAFSDFESIHTVGYSYLNESLGLEDYSAFLQDPPTKAKIDRLMQTKGKTKEEIALSLAIFSAFNEGVNLFSSFAILINFSRFNKLKGTAKINEWSLKDEVLHSDAGCWLFNTLIQEHPEIKTEEFKEKIYEAARLTVKLEDDYLDKVFELGDIEGLKKEDLKQFIRFRTNSKLNQLGYGSLYKNIKQESLNNLNWFNYLISGTVNQDFFAGKDASYSKAVLSFDKLWE